MYSISVGKKLLCFAYGQILATSVGYKASRMELISSYLSLRDVLRPLPAGIRLHPTGMRRHNLRCHMFFPLAFFGFLSHESLLAIILSFSQSFLCFSFSFLLLIQFFTLLHLPGLWKLNFCTFRWLVLALAPWGPGFLAFMFLFTSFLEENPWNFLLDLYRPYQIGLSNSFR